MMIRMMGFRGGLMCQPGVRCMPSRSAATLKNACPSKPTATKSKAVVCPHTTPRMTKLASEAAKAQKTSGFLSKRWSNSKKCPKFCSYMDRQCPPLIPPIVKPKLPPTKDLALGQQPKGPELRIMRPPQTDVPFAAVMAYRLFVFGAKLGVAGYCIKWTIDNGIWGRSQETSELWERFSSSLQRNIPQIHVLSGVGDTSHTLTQCWNATVITMFDAMIDASRWVKRKAVETERQVYGLPALKSSGDEDREVYGSIKLKLGNLTERWWNDKTDEDNVEDSDVIQTDSAEYYGTKPGSAITEIEEQEVPTVEVEEGEDITDLLSIEVPEFELEILITKPSMESDLISTIEQDKNSNSENVNVIEIETEDNKSQKENSLPETVTANELTGKRCHCNKSNVPMSERSNLEDTPPCTRPDCPFYVKPKETSQENNSTQLNTN